MKKLIKFTEAKMQFLNQLYGKKRTTVFVMRMRELDKLKKPKLLWDSMTQGTYIRAKHGELK